MYWLWKWLESCNICTFSTWKDKCLFNLLFWIPNLFCTFHDLVREEPTSFPPLTARHWFFIIQIFEQLACPEKQSCPETFHCVEIFFYLSGLLSNLCLPWKIEFALKIFTALKYFSFFRIFEELELALKTEFVMKFFTAFNLLFTVRIFEQLLLAPKTECALNSLHWIWIF